MLWALCVAIGIGVVCAGNSGELIDGFALCDAQGETVRLADYKDKALVVVVFLGDKCPLTKLYARRLQGLGRSRGRSAA